MYFNPGDLQLTIIGVYMFITTHDHRFMQLRLSLLTGKLSVETT